MTRLRTYFHPDYAPDDIPSLARLGAAARHLREHGLADIAAPPAFDRSVLRGLHAERYLEAFERGTEPLASSQGIAWSPRMRDASYAMLAGQLAAVDHALRHGIAMNLARGFHHAVFERGAGFCPLNGLALVAHRHPGLKVFVVDCDEHGGNGTEEYAARLPNLYNASMFGTRFGCIGNMRSWPYEVRLARDGRRAHLAALAHIEAHVRATRPDLLLYQAGADSHERDPKSCSGFSTRALSERDLFVFTMARRLAIPVVVVVAGGYQDAEAIARINATTVRCAVRVFARGHPPRRMQAGNDGAGPIVGPG
jgi:acetoin utilization deacetylase AcuC-like enzyme